MMKGLIAIGLAAVMLTFAPLRVVRAQESGLSVDATIGGGHAFGGAPLDHRAVASLDALVAFGRRAPSVSSTVYGLALNAQGKMDFGDVCHTTVPGGPCLKDFPALASIALLAGRSRSLPLGGSVAVLGGAGVYFPEGGSNALGFREHGGTALGLQARVDGATAVKAHMAFLVSLRGALLPNLRGDSYRLLALGIGMRFQ
jgi:hypothetical protein